MAIAAHVSVWQSALVSRTCGQYARAVLLALATLACGGLLYLIESVLLGLDNRCIQNPGSTMMRAGGIAHFCMGWLFLFTSRQLRQRRALLRLGFWTVTGGLLCVLAGSIGTLSHPLLFSAFYGFFLFHEVRDQASLFEASGEAPPTPESNRIFLPALTQAATLVLWTLATIGIFRGLVLRSHPALLSMAPAVLAGLAGFLILSVGLCWRAWRIGVREHGSGQAVLHLHAPLLLVYLGILGVLLLGTVLGAVALNLIILIHGGTWFFFVWERLRESPPRPVRNPWDWLRSTPNGFLVLHLGMFVLVLTLFALRVHVWERSGWFCEVLAANSFMYWSLMHIAMSLWRGR